MLTGVHFYRFKQFRDGDIPLKSSGLNLVAGGNNSGKSSLLHGIAIWEFCKNVIRAEKGTGAFLPSSRVQGVGLSAEEFSPINVPSLRHLWTNLYFQKQYPETDGYTLRIRCHWERESQDRFLEFGLSLANDRLFIKTTNSNLAPSDRIPVVAYLPPFAGITDKEVRVPLALRRRRIGEGLAGAVMRNILLDLQERNKNQRSALQGNRKKLPDSELQKLRKSDPWEILQDTLRRVFGAELIVAPFSEEYHSYIRVDIAKGKIEGRRLKRYPKYRPRDIMVEGAGFLQWLSVYALAADPSIDVLLLDEPDAHLHPALQNEITRHLEHLAESTGKQVLVATHSSEILRSARPESILEINTKRAPRFLIEERQKVRMLYGMGAEYAPKIDRIKRTRQVIFLEGTSDWSILSDLASRLGENLGEKWIPWLAPTGHKERRQVFCALEEEIPGLFGISLRDRDTESRNSVDEDLKDKTVGARENFIPLKWKRRNIESYLIHPRIIGNATGLDLTDIESWLRDRHGVAVGAKFLEHECPQALQDVDGKEVLATFELDGVTAARYAREEVVPEDIRTFIQWLKGTES